MKRHFARIDHFSFDRGSQIYPGFYRVYLSYRLGKRERGHSDVIYLGEGNEEEFAGQLKTYRESIDESFKNYSSELGERYATLGILLDKTESLFRQLLQGGRGKVEGRFF